MIPIHTFHKVTALVCCEIRKMEGFPHHKHCQVCSEHAAACCALLRAGLQQSDLPRDHCCGLAGSAFLYFMGAERACWGDMLFTGGLTDKKLPVFL